MQRRTVTFLLFAAVLVAAAGVMWSQRRGDPELPVEPFVDHPVVTTREPVVPEPATASPTKDGFHVRVEVTPLETFVAPPSPRARAVNALGTELVATVLVGVGAGFADEHPRAGLALAAIAVDGGASLVRQIDVPDGGRGESAVGTRVLARGVVKDDKQRPIAGARVWFGETDSAGVRREAVTDENGAFETDIFWGGVAPFVVQAVGHASHWQALRVEVPPEVQVVLHPATTLTVRLATTSTAIESTRVFVVPGSDVSTEVAHYPFFLQAFDGGLVPDATGGVTIADLPTAGSVGVVVVHPRAAIAAAQEVTLKAEPRKVIQAVAQTSNVWRAAVVDDEGAPIDGVAVWSRPRGRGIGGKSSLRFLPSHLDAVGCYFARTGADGAFAIGIDVNEGSSPMLSLRAAGHAGRDLSLPMANDEPIVLPAWRGGEPSFRLLPPRAGVAWSAETNLGGGVLVPLAADRPWVVSFPHAGRFDVVLTTKQGDAVVGARTQRNVVVTGEVELQSPSPP